MTLREKILKQPTLSLEEFRKQLEEVQKAEKLLRLSRTKVINSLRWLDAKSKLEKSGMDSQSVRWIKMNIWQWPQSLSNSNIRQLCSKINRV